jgi:hypothetical protein
MLSEVIRVKCLSMVFDREKQPHLSPPPEKGQERKKTGASMAGSDAGRQKRGFFIDFYR